MGDELKPRTIIAMKGAPCTRKSTYATLIASALSCPLFRMEEFLDILGPNDLQFAPLGDMNLLSQQSPQEMASMIIGQMTSFHLANKVVDNIVIDSIYSQSHLESFLQALSFWPKTRLIIVECKPNNLESWKILFEEHIKKAEDGVLPIMWYKAKTWEDVKEGIESDQYVDFWEYSLAVSKLVIDPHEDCPSTNVSTLMSECDQPKNKPPPFMDALEYMMTRNDGPGVVPYHKWRECPDPTKLMEALTGKDKCQRKGHRFTNFIEELGDEEALFCMACEEQVKCSAYTCVVCNLLLHKECAESFNHDALAKPYPDIFRPEAPTYACLLCKKHDNGLSGEDCASCLFETNAKRGMMATVVRHDCDEHFLSLILLAQDGEGVEECRCSACSYLVSHVFYTCEVCDKYYHIQCLNEIPSTLRNDHLEKHDHIMRADFSNEYEWYYDCQDCRYSANLGSFFDKEESGQGWTWIARKEWDST